MPTKSVKISDDELRTIRSCVKLFTAEKEKFERFARTLYLDLIDHEPLKPFIHFAKYRLKNVDHLEKKLIRKALQLKSEGKPFDINESNLFNRIQDLGGVRILHLHTDQMKAINPLVISLFKEMKYKIVEGPIANIWDEEYRDFFDQIGIKTKSQPKSMYTSVHYVVKSNTRTLVCCELQIRTLTEELWGEVSHTINYPEKTGSVPCSEQLKVLARATSTCTRLVDSIFVSYEDHKKSVT